MRPTRASLQPAGLAGKVFATGDDFCAHQPTSTPARTYLWDVSWLP